MDTDSESTKIFFITSKYDLAKMKPKQSEQPEQPERLFTLPQSIHFSAFPDNYEEVLR